MEHLQGAAACAGGLSDVMAAGTATHQPGEGMEAVPLAAGLAKLPCLLTTWWGNGVLM